MSGEKPVHWMVAEIEAERRAQQLAGAYLLGDLMVQFIKYRPPKREHWWQVWRRP